MKKKASRRAAHLAEIFDPQKTRLMHVAGRCVKAEVETAASREKVDHVWISLDAGLSRPVLIAVNTLSRKSLKAGFDPRVRLGVLGMQAGELPHPGARPWPWLSYRDYENRHNIFYEAIDRGQAESIFLEWALRAKFIEAWGAPFFRKKPGLHQVHSRSRSCAVAEDLVGVDGALRFIFGDEAKMVFLKFCGQE